MVKLPRKERRLKQRKIKINASMTVQFETTLNKLKAAAFDEILLVLQTNGLNHETKVAKIENIYSLVDSLKGQIQK